jgi:hypothetical protein
MYGKLILTEEALEKIRARVSEKKVDDKKGEKK